MNRLPILLLAIIGSRLSAQSMETLTVRSYNARTRTIVAMDYLYRLRYLRIDKKAKFFIAKEQVASVSIVPGMAINVNSQGEGLDRKPATISWIDLDVPRVPIFQKNKLTKIKDAEVLWYDPVLCLLHIRRSRGKKKEIFRIVPETVGPLRPLINLVRTKQKLKISFSHSPQRLIFAIEDYDESER